jgi:hypothetical protein
MIKKFPVKQIYNAIPGLDDFLKCFELNEVLAKGGLIAGGFPRHMMRHGVDQEPTRNYFMFGHGDIDIFYPSRAVMKSVLSSRVRARRKGYTYRSSIGGYSVEELVTPTDFCTVKIQHVACVSGEPEEILSQFDLVNSTVGFDKEFVYFHEERAKFEHKNILAINTEASLNPFLPSRLGKYVRRHGYRGIDRYSFDKVQDYVFEVILSSATNQFPLSEKLATLQSPFNLYNELSIDTLSPTFISPPGLVSIVGRLAPFMTRDLILPFLSTHFSVSSRSSYGSISTVKTNNLGQALLRNEDLGKFIVSK